MEFYSFENLDRNVDGFYDLFKKTVINNTDIISDTFDITRDIEYRPDLAAKFAYGSNEYIEELLTMNGIINPFALKKDTTIFKAFNNANLQSMYKSDVDENIERKKKLLNINKNKTSKSNNYPPTVKPDGLKQLNMNYNKKKITIMNRFK